MSPAVKAVVATLVIVAIANAIVLLYIRSQGGMLAVVPADPNVQQPRG